MELFKIKAEITIKIGVRTLPVKNGYRPGFVFTDKGQTSGSIRLLKNIPLFPGETGLVEISFVSDSILGYLDQGTKFKFYEGPVEIGFGKVIQVLDGSK